MAPKAASRAQSLDRAAAVRAALRRLVARHGFHGASMSAVAREAGVATGTAYVHYESKEALVYAAYVELKTELSREATAKVDRTASPEKRFAALWEGLYRYLHKDPEQAKFLLQIEASPYAQGAHELYMALGTDALTEIASMPDLVALLADLPALTLYDMSLGNAVRLAASGEKMTAKQRSLMAAQSWRAITR